MNLSKHFTLEEMTVSQTASRKGINNTPRETALKNLRNTAKDMELVRTLLNDNAIFVSSGYRSPKLNATVGGSKTSAHLKGFAVDFRCPGYGNNYKVACAIRDSDIEYDQLILEYGWIHISFDPRMRGQDLTKRSAKSPWEIGINK